MHPQPCGKRCAKGRHLCSKTRQNATRKTTFQSAKSHLSERNPHLFDFQQITNCAEASLRPPPNASAHVTTALKNIHGNTYFFGFRFEVYTFSLNFATSINKTHYYAEKAENSSDGSMLRAFGLCPKRLHRAEGCRDERDGIHIHGGSVGRRRRHVAERVDNQLQLEHLRKRGGIPLFADALPLPRV